MIAAVQSCLPLFVEIGAILAAYRLAIRRNRHVGGWVVAAILFNWFAVFMLVSSSYRYGEWSPRVACRVCGSLESPKVTKPGGDRLQILLLCCFVVPGIVYAIWRKSGEKLVCNLCGSEQVDPAGPADRPSDYEAAVAQRRRLGESPVSRTGPCPPSGSRKNLASQSSQR